MSRAMVWKNEDGLLELQLQRAPCNEIGEQTLQELEEFVEHVEGARAVLIHSALDRGFCAGADLRELFRRGGELSVDDRVAGVRDFLERIHAVLNRIDAAPCPTFAAVHGICFGGGLELALACDVIVADSTARFAFPELRLGLIPGFGGLPRLKRDVSNALVRDILLTGRSINAQKALQASLVSQVVREGKAPAAARAAAAQALKFDRETAAACKRFVKPIPAAELAEEMDIFLDLFRRPVVQDALQKFTEDEGPMPYLP